LPAANEVRRAGQRLRRLRVGELLALAGAICVIISLLLPWYEGASGSLSVWETFGPAAALLIAAALAALALVATTLAERSTALPVAAAVWSTLFAIAALIAAVVRLLERPDHASSLCAGAWLALGGALAMLAGSWQSMRDERTGSYPPAEPPRRQPPPP
jgi:H+/Cl- antiporter ClcA